MSSYEIYCLCHNNPERKARMTERFRKYAGKEANFPPTVGFDDPRVSSAPSNFSKACVSMVYGHLDMMRTFLSSDAEFGIFSEDDVFIRRDFKDTIQVAMDGYKRLGLDILLLGYLANYRPAITTYQMDHTPLEPTFSFLSFNNELWGSQMFLLNRAGAAKILEEFREHKPERVLSPDWCITKFGRRGAIYPMLAVEEGAVATGHPAHVRYHNQCRDIQYDPKVYD